MMHSTRSACSAVRAARLPRSKSGQSGQALVLGMFMIVAAMLGVYFMFSTGQVISTKARLVNATDAAAYSAATWRARALNFAAYSNRAIVAQEVAVAQAVTLVSYAKFIESFSANAAAINSDIPGVGPALAAWASTAGPTRVLTESIASAEIKLRSDDTIGYKSLLEKSQSLVLAASNGFALSSAANEVVKANDSSFFAHTVVGGDSLNTGFLKQYNSDAERQRLKGVVLDSLDNFVMARNGTFWPITSIMGACAGIPWPGRIERNGGTALSPAGNGLERWEAGDTASVHTVRAGGFLGLSCHWRETLPLGWGSAEAARMLQHSLTDNPGNIANNGAAAVAASGVIDSSPANGFESYNGISRVHDLDYEALNQARYPTRRVAIFGEVGRNAVRTAEALGVGKGRFNLPATYAGQKISTVSAAEVYFKRPPTAPVRVEYANLYNPYWHARLVNPTAVERATAEAAYVRGGGR